VVEWNALTQQLNDNGLIAASRLAFEAGQPDRAIAAAIRTQSTHDFSLRYPKPFKDIIAERAEEKGLSPGWVLGLIRQESRFLTAVKSPVGATGLMQLMPQTAQSVARSLGMPRLDTRALAEPSVNVRLGTAYLRDMKELFEGSAVLASAAYNAGPSRSRLWRASLDRTVPGAAFAESIPFTETRDYVKQVLANTVMYEVLLSQQANTQGQQTLSQWLSEIGPRAASPSPGRVTRVGMTKDRL
jgi:soluble lytic murein transglycosylase